MMCKGTVAGWPWIRLALEHGERSSCVQGHGGRVACIMYMSQLQSIKDLGASRCGQHNTTWRLDHSKHTAATLPTWTGAAEPKRQQRRQQQQRQQGDATTTAAASLPNMITWYACTVVCHVI
jgi:hypothetical protein